MKPALILPSTAGGIAVNIRQTAKAALEQYAQTGLFFRKGLSVVRMVSDQKLGAKFVPVTSAYMQTQLFEMFNIAEWRGRGNSAQLRDSIEIKDITLKGILGSDLVETLILPVQVISRVQYLVLEGAELVLLKQGYNPQRGGIYVTGSEPPEEVPTEKAAAAISAIFSDYDFATPSDRSRCIAGVLCTAMRLAGVFERMPFLVYEADLSQTGKTKMWATTIAMNGQRCGTVTQKKGGVGSLDEQIMEKLVDGCPAVLFDNMKGRLDSPFFEACMASEGGSLSARIAGVRGMEVDPGLTQFGLTSNGVELTTDAANRAMMIRIRKRRSGYAFRQWTNAKGKPVDLRQHVEAHTRFYTGCVHSIVLDWWKNGAQQEACSEHDFAESVGALDYMVQRYFGLPSLMDGHRATLDRSTKPGMSWLRGVALKAAKDWIVTDWKATKLAESCARDGVAIPGAEGKDADTAAQKIGSLMAEAFGSQDMINVDGVEVIRKQESDSKGRWNKTYTFKRVQA